MIEDESAKLTGADLVLHIPDREFIQLTDEDSDESGNETLGNVNHLGKRMLNTLCHFAPHNRDEAAEMDKALPSISGLLPASTTEEKRKKAKVSLKVLWRKEVLFLA